MEKQYMGYTYMMYILRDTVGIICYNYYRENNINNFPSKERKNQNEMGFENKHPMAIIEIYTNLI